MVKGKSIFTRAVHAGERGPKPDFQPVSTPIYSTVGYRYESMEDLDRIFGNEREGYVYARYGSPTNAALEQALTAVEEGEAALTFGSGMAAVYASLLAIHHAQEQSIRLLRRGLARPAGVDVVRLSFDKGGTSVLADGYLAAGSLSGEQARFVFNWGVLLQLADDLQDVRQDCQDGMLTVFTEHSGRAPKRALNPSLASGVMAGSSR